MKKILFAITAVLALSACGPDTTQFNDANVGVVSDTPQFVMTNLDGFPNVAVRCFGEHGIYTTTRQYGDALTIIENDPNCDNGDLLEWIANEFTGTYDAESTDEDG